MTDMMGFDSDEIKQQLSKSITLNRFMYARCKALEEALNAFIAPNAKPQKIIKDNAPDDDLITIRKIRLGAYRQAINLLATIGNTKMSR